MSNLATQEAKKAQKREDRIFNRVKAAYIKFLKEEAESEGNMNDCEYWNDLEPLKTPEEFISHILHELHTDSEDACEEMYYLITSLIT